MSETKTAWTPGPWWTDAAYDEDDLGCSIIAANPDHGPMPGNPTRGQVAFSTAILPEDVETAQANAHLIAAAPAMAEALEQLLDDMGDDGLCVCPAAKQQAIAALALARGEYPK